MTISDTTTAELKKLRVELALATKRATEAGRTFGRPLEPKFLTRAAAEEAKVEKLKLRIAELSKA
jgi:hypothetical protein